MDTAKRYGSEKIGKLLLQLAPPVMLAQLIQALYNIVDSLFVGRYSASGLTALSIIYPVQLLMIALGVGTGVGLNTLMARQLGLGEEKSARECAGVAAPVGATLWLIFAVAGYLAMPAYAHMSTKDPQVIADVISYGRIVCVFSLGLFLESMWTKVLQAEGDMKTPMFAQIAGAALNILLDPVLIFGLGGLPEMGIAGAAAATVAGQVLAALVVMKKGLRKSPGLSGYPRFLKDIFRLGAPNMLMQSAYTFYILGLNLILAGFSDHAVTALGLYYKWQTFFFIPLGVMQTCIVPIVSFNYAVRRRAALPENPENRGAVRPCTDESGHPVLRMHPRAAAAGVYPAIAGDRNRPVRLSNHWRKLSAHGHFADLPGVFSGHGLRAEKRRPDADAHAGAVCAPGLSVFPVGPACLLADLPSDGDPYLPAGRRLLPGLPETSLRLEMPERKFSSPSGRKFRKRALQRLESML